jgi:hypothetical protein
MLFCQSNTYFHHLLPKLSPHKAMVFLNLHELLAAFSSYSEVSFGEGHYAMIYPICVDMLCHH